MANTSDVSRQIESALRGSAGVFSCSEINRDDKDDMDDENNNNDDKNHDSDDKNNNSEDKNNNKANNNRKKDDKNNSKDDVFADNSSYRPSVKEASGSHISRKTTQSRKSAMSSRTSSRLRRQRLEILREKRHFGSVPSVESYMWKGLGPTLGEVLNQEFVHCIRVNRSTQTNWQWRKMAERWKHARIIEAKCKPPVCPTRRPIYDQALYDQPAYEPPKSTAGIRQVQDKSLSLHVQVGTSFQEQDTRTSLQEQETSTSTQVLETSTSFPVQDTSTSLQVLPQDTKRKKSFTSAKSARSQNFRQNEENTQKDKLDEEGELKDKAPGVAKKDTKKDLEVPNYDVRFCRENDKCIDTFDLEFDPFDPNLVYTKRQTNVKPMYIPTELKKALSDFENLWDRNPSFAEFLKDTATKQKDEVERLKKATKKKTPKKDE